MISGVMSFFLLGVFQFTNFSDVSGEQLRICIYQDVFTAFPQNFHTRKLAEISVFYAVLASNGTFQKIKPVRDINIEIVLVGLTPRKENYEKLKAKATFDCKLNTRL